MLENISSGVRYTLDYSSKLSPSSLGTIWKFLRNACLWSSNLINQHHHPSSRSAAKLEESSTPMFLTLTASLAACASYFFLHLSTPLLLLSTALAHTPLSAQPNPCSPY